MVRPAVYIVGEVNLGRLDVLNEDCLFHGSLKQGGIGT